jgi:hypothetical protein
MATLDSAPLEEAAKLHTVVRPGWEELVKKEPAGGPVRSLNTTVITDGFRISRIGEN